MLSLPDREGAAAVTRKRKVCAVCGRVLDFWEGKGWLHPLADPTLDDHPAVPVSDTEVPVVAKCDFCYADSPGWIIPARTFASMGAKSAEDWAACDSCVVLIEKNQWNALLRRVKVSWEERSGPMDSEVEARLKALYRTLRKHITGAPRPVE